MTLATTDSRVSYNGNGVTTAFSFPYRFLQDSDLTVILVTVATGVETTQVLTTNYTVTGAGDDAGGTVTMLVAPSSGTRLIIERIVPVTQEMDYIEGDNFPASSHETALDKLTMIAQQNRRLLDRSLRLPTGLADTVSTQLPYPSAGSALIWNSTGTGLTNGVPSDSEGLIGVSTFMETVLGSVDGDEARANIEAVGLTGNETIYNVKTFDESPVIPDATADDEPASKGQMDAAITDAVAAVTRGGVRQTVLSGPVNSSGFSAFGGSTGSTTVTASGTLIVSAANGFNTSGSVDRLGSITNPSWISLAVDGTYYLYLTINSDGSCTTGSTTLAPVYQHGGTYSTTSGQFTFNISEMVGKVGNGSAANQAYRVFVGEVAVSGSVVTSIVWYALCGRYEEGGITIPSAGTLTSKNHDLGVIPGMYGVSLTCDTAEANYSIGDRIPRTENGGGPSYYHDPVSITYRTIGIVSGNTNLVSLNKTTGASVNLTRSKWKYHVIVRRGW